MGCDPPLWRDEGDLVEDDIFLASQLDRIGNPFFAPERALWAAVLEDALILAARGTLRRGGLAIPGAGDVGPRSRRYGPTLIAEARAWIASDSERVQSFRWVCGALGLDPDYLRDGLTKAKNLPTTRGVVHGLGHRQQQAITRGAA